MVSKEIIGDYWWLILGCPVDIFEFRVTEIKKILLDNTIKFKRVYPSNKPLAATTNLIKNSSNVI